jgi:mitogen-activated protein kinase kinase kinase
MAMLASKSPYPTPSLGGSSSQASAQYNSSISNYRNHASNARADHSVFASPTESEFSEIYDAPDAVRYVKLPCVPLRVKLTCADIGTKTRWLTG